MTSKKITDEQFQILITDGFSAIRDGSFKVGKEYTIINGVTNDEVIAICSQSQPYVLKIIQ